MSDQFGTENLKKVANVIVEIGMFIPKFAKADSAISKAIAIGSIVDDLVVMMSVNWPRLRKEWDDLDDQEKAEIKAGMKAKYDIANDKLEEIVEQAFELACRQVELGAEMVLLAKKVKAK